MRNRPILLLRVIGLMKHVITSVKRYDNLTERHAQIAWPCANRHAEQGQNEPPSYEHHTCLMLLVLVGSVTKWMVATLFLSHILHQSIQSLEIFRDMQVIKPPHADEVDEGFMN